MSCGPPVQVGVCSGCCLESRGGRTVNLRAPDVTQRLRPVFLSLSLFFLSSLSLSLSLSLLHSSTFTSLLSVCQHFPSGGVRHGVRAPGLPASASSHCDLQPRHLSSACQCRSRPLLGFYTESLPPCQEKSFLVVWPISNCNAFCNGSKGTTERAPITDLC